jgi:O-antigen ligase
MKRALSTTLLALLGAGILMSWNPVGLAWHGFEALIFALTLIWLGCWVAGALEARWTLAFLPFVAILAIGCLQLAQNTSAYAFATHQDLIRWGGFLAVTFLAYQLFDTEDEIRRFRAIFLAFALIVAVVSTLQWFAGNGKIFWLFTSQEPASMGPFLNRDHYASFVALALPMALYEMVRQPQRRWIFAITSAALYASVIACASRAGFALTTAEIVISLVLVGFSSRIVLAQIALILVFGSVVGWGFLFERLSYTDPYAGRREIAHATVQMIKANPWHGYGLGTWTDVYPQFAEKDLGAFINAAHNDWLQWGAEGGIPMMIAMGLLLGGSVLILRKSPWALGVPIVFVHGLIDFPMQGRFLPCVVFTVLATAMRIPKSKRRSAVERPQRLARQSH